MSTTIDRVARRESPGGEPQIVAYRPFDRTAAICLVDTVRRAMPDCDAVTGLRACRTLADLRNHPDKAAAIAAVFDLPSDGTSPDFAPAPTAWTATRHEQRPDGEVSRFGMARVQGATIGTSPDTPLGASGGLLSQMLEDLPRNSVGVAALDLYRLTQVFYGHDEQLPRMIGTDVSQRHQMIHAGDVDPASCRVAVGGLTTVCTLQTWPWRGEHDSHTGDTSVLGKVYLRASERRGPGMLAAAATDNAGATTFHHVPLGEREHVPTRYDVRDDLGREFVCTGRNRAVTCGYLGYWREPLGVDSVRDLAGNPVTVCDTLEHSPETPASERIWVGHRLVKRGKLAARKPRVKLEARTVATVAVLTPTHLANNVATLNRGERAVFDLAGHRVTVTRGQGEAGTFSLTTPHGKASGLRTPAGVARRVHELLTA